MGCAGRSDHRVWRLQADLSSGTDPSMTTEPLDGREGLKGLIATPRVLPAARTVDRWCSGALIASVSSVADLPAFATDDEHWCRHRVNTDPLSPVEN
jgi:hypothetical protein